ncbi:MAG: DegT/DnrJ/EryC1/StrS family aminotransferase, partial [Patescibacteria group bacterium]
MKIPLSQPDITNKETKKVLEVLKSKTLSLGQKLPAFEKAVADFIGVKYTVAVNSGTSALHLIMRAFDIKDGDEVITSPFSFIASANCVLFERAKPVFVDIKSDTLNINPELVEGSITSKTKAILVPDIFSHPADWDELKKIAKKHKLFLIEDSAESFGSLYKGKKCGSFGDVAIFAFSPNKQITMGEGGIILTNKEWIANFCRSSASQGRKIKNGKWLEHVRLGYNYRLNEMSCAVGLAQVERADEIIAKRRKVAGIYNKKLSAIKNIELPFVAGTAKISWFVYAIKLAGKIEGKRDLLMKKLKERGIESRDYFQSIHLQPFYKKMFGYKKGDFPVTEDVSKRTLALPFFANMKESQMDFVI